MTALLAALFPFCLAMFAPASADARASGKATPMSPTYVSSDKVACKPTELKTSSARKLPPGCKTRKGS